MRTSSGVWISRMAVVVAALTGLSSLTANGAGTIYVTESGTPVPPYDTWATAATNIQTAIDYASTNLALHDTVLVTNGNFAVTNTISITNGVKVISLGGAAETVVYRTGAAAFSVFTLTHSNAVLDGFTITNGFASAGGGINMTAGTVRNCTLTKNSGVNGGGFYMTAGTVSNCLVFANTVSGSGAGGEARGGVIVDCVISNNAAGFYGGGIWCSAGTPIINRCRILNNTASKGYGAGMCGNGSPILRNCLIAGNVSVGEGGGAYGGTLENCTVVNNSATGSGGGTHTSTLKNCIVYFNSAPSFQNVFGGTATYTCSMPKRDGVGNIEDDPQFVNAAAGNFQLRFGSKAIDAGTTIAAVVDDIEGIARPQSGNGLTTAYDMGCYEAPATTTGVFRCLFTVSPVGGLESLTATCTAVIAGEPAVTNVQYYWWDFGDGQSTNGTDLGQVTHTFGPGRFTISLTVSNDLGSVTNWTETDAVKISSETVYVTEGGTGSFPYSSWATAAGNLQDAVSAAQTAYEAGALNACVWVSNGTFSVASTVRLSTGIRVQSTGGRDNTVVYRTGAVDFSVFTLTHSNAVLDGFTITNGFASAGGGINMTAGTVRNCTLTKNRGLNGGGFYMTAGTVSNCLVFANTVSSSGAGGEARGGVIVDCVISNNAAGFYGGGIWCSAGTPIIDRCRIVNNTASDYGAGMCGSGTPILRNCLIAGNVSTLRAGGTFRGTLENCTVVNNSATLDGGGTHTSTLKNCIVFFNTASSGTNISGGTATYTCSTPKPSGTGNIEDDPLFVNATAGDFRLQPGSLCVNAGTTIELAWLGPGSVDLGGDPRLYGPSIDMGAYEWQPPQGTMIILR